MEHGGAKGIDVRSRLDLTGEQLWRRIPHRADRGHALFGGSDRPGNSKIDKHDSPGLIIEHQVGRFQIPVYDGRNLRMDVGEHVANLNCPLRYYSFLDSTAESAHLFGEVATADPLHNEVVTAAFYEVIIDRRNRRVL